MAGTWSGSQNPRSQLRGSQWLHARWRLGSSVHPPGSSVFLCGDVGQSETFPLTPLPKLLPLTSSSHWLLRQMALAPQSRLLWLHGHVSDAQSTIVIMSVGVCNFFSIKPIIRYWNRLMDSNNGGILRSVEHVSFCVAWLISVTKRFRWNVLTFLFRFILTVCQSDVYEEESLLWIRQTRI